MVSRAVEKKKARREKKLHRDEGCVVPNVTKPPPKDDEDEATHEEGDYNDDSYYGGYANNSGYSNYGGSSSYGGAAAAAPKRAVAPATTIVPASNVSKTSFKDDDDAADAAAAPVKASKAPKTARAPAAATSSANAEFEANDAADEGHDDEEAPKAKARRVDRPAVSKKDAEATEVPATAAAPLPASHIVTKLTTLDRPLTRKERMKLETAQRAEKQLERQQRLGERLDAAEAEALQQYKASVAEAKKAKKAEADEEGDDVDASGSGDEADAPEAPKLPEIHMRHDERFVGGTYWKERKERKRKTLFVGNLPMYYDQHITKDYIVGILESHGLADGAAKDEDLEQKMLDFANGTISEVDKVKPGKKDKDGGFYGAHCPLLSIDFLPTKANAKTKHAYVCFRTYELAVEAQKLLDGSRPEAQNPSRLRVNFSDDKDQRGTAINKREGSKNLRGGVPRGGGRGFGAGRGVGGRGAAGGRGFGGGRGGARGGARGGRGAGGSMGGGRGRTFGPGFGFGPGRGRGGASAPAAPASE